MLNSNKDKLGHNPRHSHETEESVVKMHYVIYYSATEQDTRNVPMHLFPRTELTGFQLFLGTMSRDVFVAMFQANTEESLQKCLPMVKSWDYYFQHLMASPDMSAAGGLTRSGYSIRLASCADL